ncbi:MAG: hypothetical protein JWO41_775 [Candidatus Saccharibacteria bacterium]|nr:hypothetical protein [Candidatus Saccharibacteria bacterium]
MATEWETEAHAELESSAREEKVNAFLNSGYASQVADLALAAYWDHIQASIRADKIERDIRIDSYGGRLSKADMRSMRTQQTQAATEASVQFRTAADYAAIAGAVALAQTQRGVEA